MPQKQKSNGTTNGGGNGKENMSLPKVCVIGAGSSGIAICKELYEEGIPFDCFEKSDRIGGNWVFKNVNGMSSAYRSLHINTSRDKMSYASYPMSHDLYPDYPHHEQIARYFDDYVDHFGFRHKIIFGTAVTWCRRRDDGLWDITLDNGETRVYDALAVVNGHHWDPRLPEPSYPGHFDGEQIHSHHYIDPKEPVAMEGKRVLIVGFGNSALDLACELGRKGVADTCFMALRRGYWVIPRYFGDDVLDFFNPHPSENPPLLSRILPASWQIRLLTRRVAQVAGTPERHGLPKPDHHLLSTHPAISQDIYNRIGSGDVLIRQNVKKLDGDGVIFEDGTREKVDVIIWCTGYKVTFPFLDKEFISAPGNDIALWKRMVEPAYPDLFFVGLLQPLCAMMPIAEEQGKFLRAYLTGQYALPSREDMDAERHEMHKKIKAIYVDTPRHTIQINCGEYTHDLRRELRKGKKRAVRAGNPLPIEARAHKETPRKTGKAGKAKKTAKGGQEARAL